MTDQVPHTPDSTNSSREENTSNASPLAHFTTSKGVIQPSIHGVLRSETALGWLGDACDIEGAYIHVPFCFHKCHYCDFFSVTGTVDQQASFVDRLCRELTVVGSHIKSPLKTVFIGGGTPTILTAPHFKKMLGTLRATLPLDESCEWTIEANPETITTEIVELMVEAGVNRVSIGAQSFDPTLLKTLERWHDPLNVERAVRLFQSAGIDNINIDLIYAIPGQMLEQVEEDLSRALSLQPTHLSCYALIYEHNTPLRVKLDRGDIQRVPHEVEAEMFEKVQAVLQQAAFEQYEISNFAKRGFQCVHNLLYWKNRSWWPFGPAAAGHSNGLRWRNTPRLSEYLSSTEMPPIEDVEFLEPDQRAGEIFMVGLRLMEGMDRALVEDLLAQSTDRWRDPMIEKYLSMGLLSWIDNKLALTRQGILVADTVISGLLMNGESMADTTRRPPNA